MDLGLTNRIALVTGASQGLGRAVSLRLAAAGAKVVVNYYPGQEDKANAVVDEIQQTFGVDAMSVAADVSKEDDVVRMYRRIEEQFSPVEVLVNNAAVAPTCKVKDMSLKEWSDTLAVNLNGAFLTSREMIRRAIDAGIAGRIVNVATSSAFRGSTSGRAHYDSSKGALVSFTISLAREVAPHGIRVNAVAPGMIMTEMTAARIEANMEKYLAHIPLNRVGTPEEVANVIAFLASDQASYMTGATVDVSGGLLMR